LYEIFREAVIKKPTNRIRKYDYSDLELLKGMNGKTKLKIVEKLELKGRRSVEWPIIRKLSQVLEGIKKRGKG